MKLLISLMMAHVTAFQMLLMEVLPWNSLVQGSRSHAKEGHRKADTASRCPSLISKHEFKLLCTHGGGEG